MSMRVINHLMRKKVKRDDDVYVYDPGAEQATGNASGLDRTKSCFMDFLEDRQKEEVYDDITEFIRGHA